MPLLYIVLESERAGVILGFIGVSLVSRGTLVSHKTAKRLSKMCTISDCWGAQFRKGITSHHCTDC